MEVFPEKIPIAAYPMSHWVCRLGRVLVASWPRLGRVLVASWSRPGRVLVASWSRLGRVLVASWSRLGLVLVTFSACLRPRPLVRFAATASNLL